MISGQARPRGWHETVVCMPQVNTTTDRGVVERRTSRLTLVDLAGTGLPLLQCQAATGHQLSKAAAYSGCMLVRLQKVHGAAMLCMSTRHAGWGPMLVQAVSVQR